MQSHGLLLRTCRRRPTLWRATVSLFDLLKIELSKAKGECPKKRLLTADNGQQTNCSAGLISPAFEHSSIRASRALEYRPENDSLLFSLMYKFKSFLFLFSDPFKSFFIFKLPFYSDVSIIIL
jgi:hypothetical protein